MANIKISDLTSAASVSGTQQFEVNESGTSKKVTGAQIATYVEGEISSSPSFTGQVSNAAGSAAAPSITVTGDTNTGIYFPAADTIGISTGGTLRVSVDSAGSLVTAGAIELGNASDTTISRVSTGIIAVEGKKVVTEDASGNAAITGMVVPSSSFLRNRIINGDMRIDQRNAGASVTINSGVNTYVMDRWFGVGQAADGVFSMSRSAIGLSSFTNGQLVTVTTADVSIGATQAYARIQKIEGNNISDFSFGNANATPITLSFWVFSSVAGIFGGAIANEAHNRSCPFTYTVNAINTWEYKTVTLPGDTGGTWVTDSNSAMRVIFSLGAGSSLRGTAGTWAAATYWSATGETALISTLSAQQYLTGVQLEAGSVSTPFERRQYGQELALCQRYYEKTSAQMYVNFNTSNVPDLIPGSWRVEKRTAPTVSVSAASNINTATAFGTSGWSLGQTGTGVASGVLAATITGAAEL